MDIYEEYSKIVGKEVAEKLRLEGHKIGQERKEKFIKTIVNFNGGNKMNSWEEEQKIIEELNDFYYNKLKFCGCGSPQDILLFIKNILNTINQEWEERNSLSLSALEMYNRDQDRLHKTFEFADYSKPKNKFTDVQEGIIAFVLNHLNSVDVLEHGGSVGGSWLSEYGKQILEYLNSFDNLDDVLE